MFDVLSLGDTDVAVLGPDFGVTWTIRSDYGSLGKTFKESGFSIEKSGNDRR